MCPVERFDYTIDMAVFALSPPGRCQLRAVDLALTAGALGRRIIAWTHKADMELTRHAHIVLPVHGEVREGFSPWLYNLFARYWASYLAERLGR